MLFTKKIKEAKTFDENGNVTEWVTKKVPRDFSKVGKIGKTIGKTLGQATATAVMIKVIDLGFEVLKENLG